jgi:hypothetical protein
MRLSNVTRRLLAEENFSLDCLSLIVRVVKKLKIKKKEIDIPLFDNIKEEDNLIIV